MMPELPKKKLRLEAKITPKVLEWFRQNYPYTVALEIKIGNAPLLPHQRAALMEVHASSFAHKIRDTAKNPFDAFVLQHAEAFVVRCEEHTCVAERIDGEKSFSFTV